MPIIIYEVFFMLDFGLLLCGIAHGSCETFCSQKYEDDVFSNCLVRTGCDVSFPGQELRCLGPDVCDLRLQMDFHYFNGTNLTKETLLLSAVTKTHIIKRENYLLNLSQGCQQNEDDNKIPFYFQISFIKVHPSNYGEYYVTIYDLYDSLTVLVYAVRLLKTHVLPKCRTVATEKIPPANDMTYLLSCSIDNRYHPMMVSMNSKTNCTFEDYPSKENAQDDISTWIVTVQVLAQSCPVSDIVCVSKSKIILGDSTEYNCTFDGKTDDKADVKVGLIVPLLSCFLIICILTGVLLGIRLRLNKDSKDHEVNVNLKLDVMYIWRRCRTKNVRKEQDINEVNEAQYKSLPVAEDCNYLAITGNGNTEDVPNSTEKQKAAENLPKCTYDYSMVQRRSNMTENLSDHKTSSISNQDEDVSKGNENMFNETKYKCQIEDYNYLEIHDTKDARDKSLSKGKQKFVQVNPQSCIYEYGVVQVTPGKTDNSA